MKVDFWESYGAHAAHDEFGHKTGRSVESYLTQAIEKHGAATPKDKRSFRRGWRRGRVTAATYELNTLLNYLDAATLDQMGDEVQALARKYLGILYKEEQKQ